jgi:hypothetical protein
MFARNRVARAVSGAAFVALAATSLSLAAAEMPTGGPPAEYTAFLRMKAEDVMHAMDKTGRGKVSKAEFMKFHEDMFNQMDRNKDGVLSKDEFMGEKTAK